MSELVQMAHDHFQSEPLCTNESLPNMLFWKRFSKAMEENRRFNIELNLLLGKLGVELMKCVAKRQADVNVLEERFSAARMQLRVEFLDLSPGSLRHLFESDGMNTLLDRAVTGRPRGQVLLTSMELNTVKKIKRAFLSNFEVSVYKVFAERLYMLDRPVAHVISVDQIRTGPKSKVLYYVCGWLFQKLRAQIHSMLKGMADGDGANAKFCAEYFLHNMLARSSDGSVSMDADLSSVSSLVIDRELGGGLIYVTKPFFDFICSVEIFLGQRLSMNNLHFYGAALMKRLEHQLLSGDILYRDFAATFPDGAHSSDLFKVLLTVIVHVSAPPKPITLTSSEIPTLSLSHPAL